MQTFLHIYDMTRLSFCSLDKYQIKFILIHFINTRNLFLDLMMWHFIGLLQNFMVIRLVTNIKTLKNTVANHSCFRFAAIVDHRQWADDADIKIKEPLPFQRHGFTERKPPRYSSYSDREPTWLHGNIVPGLLEQRTFQFSLKTFPSLPFLPPSRQHLLCSLTCMCLKSLVTNLSH